MADHRKAVKEYVRQGAIFAFVALCFLLFGSIGPFAVAIVVAVAFGGLAVFRRKLLADARAKLLLRT